MDKLKIRVIKRSSTYNWYRVGEEYYVIYKDGRYFLEDGVNTWLNEEDCEIIDEIPKFNSRELIIKECDAIKSLLLEKNESYGDSALQNGVLFPHSPVISLQSRINYKLARIKNQGVDAYNENNLQDLTGYLILLMIAIKNEKK